MVRLGGWAQLEMGLIGIGHVQSHLGLKPSVVREPLGSLVGVMKWDRRADGAEGRVWW